MWLVLTALLVALLLGLGAVAAAGLSLWRSGRRLARSAGRVAERASRLAEDASRSLAEATDLS